MKALAALLAISITTASADDWPHYMGTGSDGIWKEEGIRKDLPEGGAPVAWRMPVNWGYAGPAVSDGLVYISDYKRTEGELINNPGKSVIWEGSERILCLDAKTGETKWVHETPRTYNVSYPGGPRATPTIADGLVYFLGAMGNLSVLDAKTGELKWEKDFQKDFGAPLPTWGFAAAPYVKDGTLYCLVGGEGSVAVAFRCEDRRAEVEGSRFRNAGLLPAFDHQSGRRRAIDHLEPRIAQRTQSGHG